MFVKAHLSFELEGNTLEFVHQNLAPSGVSGLPWAPLSPLKHFGKKVLIHVRLATPEPQAFKIHGTIFREQTQFSASMGIRFDNNAPLMELIRNQARKFGFMPTEYMRKYPRLPADPDIPTFPLMAMVSSPAADAQGPTPQQTILFHVSNLSPNGILIFTENQLSIGYQPGERVQIILDPRGWFPVSIKIAALICRVTDEQHPKTGNLIRSLGIKFLKVDDEQRDAFLDLLRDILERLKIRIQV